MCIQYPTNILQLGLKTVVRSNFTTERRVVPKLFSSGFTLTTYYNIPYIYYIPTCVCVCVPVYCHT